jgi:hypothetical protein
MYFLNPLLLSGALVAAQDVDQDASIPKYLNTTLAAPTPAPESTKTILVTVTHTLYPVPPYPPPTTAISSQPVAPPPFTHGGQPESPSPTSTSAEWPAGHGYTSLEMPNCDTASLAAYKGNASVTGKPMFTLNTASPSVPFEGRYTPPTPASTLPSSSTTNSSQNAPDEHLDNENAGLSATNDADMDNEYQGMENATAWSGTDNAIPAQMHDVPLQSTSAAVQRARRVWDRLGQDTQGEKRDCRPCIGEGTVLCQGDVGIGYCKGGCEALQFLGRGHGCSGSSAARLRVYTEGAVAVIAAVVYLVVAF